MDVANISLSLWVQWWNTISVVDNCWLLYSHFFAWCKAKSLAGLIEMNCVCRLVFANTINRAPTATDKHANYYQRRARGSRQESFATVDSVVCLPPSFGPLTNAFFFTEPGKTRQDCSIIYQVSNEKFCMMIAYWLIYKTCLLILSSSSNPIFLSINY